MHERIVEILMFLVSELKSNKQLNDIDVSFLTKNGYTQSEISTAFSWLFERMSVGQQMVAQSGQSEKSTRFLNEAERMIVTPPAYGYLIQCREMGLVKNSDIEIILDRIMAAGFSSIGIPEMKSFVAGILFDSGSNSSLGGQISLETDDTIH
ncbi:MAG: DUF494 domain-containing protein [Ignavibacteriae bacterium]|nr:DUF494 domain-containing protein [Ignavibacteriota bacterium]